jgi:hypothetical protein
MGVKLVFYTKGVHRLGGFDSRMLRKMVEPLREEVTGAKTA